MEKEEAPRKVKDLGATMHKWAFVLVSLAIIIWVAWDQLIGPMVN